MLAHKESLFFEVAGCLPMIFIKKKNNIFTWTMVIYLLLCVTSTVSVRVVASLILFAISSPRVLVPMDMSL